MINDRFISLVRQIGTLWNETARKIAAAQLHYDFVKKLALF